MLQASSCCQRAEAYLANQRRRLYGLRQWPRVPPTGSVPPCATWPPTFPASSPLPAAVSSSSTPTRTRIRHHRPCSTSCAAQPTRTIRLYPDPEAQALRARASAVYGVPADHILAGNGSDELLALLLRATVDPGDRVAFAVPTYSLYETLVAVQGGEVVRVDYAEDWGVPPALARPRRG